MQPKTLMLISLFFVACNTPNKVNTAKANTESKKVADTTITRMALRRDTGYQNPYSDSTLIPIALMTVTADTAWLYFEPGTPYTMLPSDFGPTYMLKYRIMEVLKISGEWCRIIWNVPDNSNHYKPGTAWMKRSDLNTGD